MNEPMVPLDDDAAPVCKNSYGNYSLVEWVAWGLWLQTNSFKDPRGKIWPPLPRPLVTAAFNPGRVIDWSDWD